MSAENLAPYVPGHRRVPGPKPAPDTRWLTTEIDPEPRRIQWPTVAMAMGIARDALIIIVLLAGLFLAIDFVHNVAKVQQQVGQFQQTPTGAPLPSDACGGGVC
jgi:hypothetical protein